MGGRRRFVLDDVSEKKRIEACAIFAPALVDQVRDLDAAQNHNAGSPSFCRHRDFSRFGEHLYPEELIALANGLFSEAVAAISDCRGLIDKFMGDAVMACLIPCSIPRRTMSNWR